MTSAWDKVHARYQLAEDVLSEVSRTGDGADAEQWREPIADVFGDFEAFLLHLQRRWYTSLMARLDAAFEVDADADLHKLVERAWTQMAACDSGVRAVLDVYADHPVLRVGDARHRRILGMTADSPDRQGPPSGSFMTHRSDSKSHARRAAVPLARSGR